MEKRNLNWLAVELAESEGQKVQLSIAQIKELILCLGKVLVSADPAVREDLILRILSSGARRAGMVKDNEFPATMHFLPHYKKRK